MSEPNRDESPEDALARMTADMDQAIAGLADAAKLLAALKGSLIEEGFSHEEAYGLVGIYFAQFVGAAMRGDIE
jgi:hypothetical protein